MGKQKRKSISLKIKRELKRRYHYCHVCKIALSSEIHHILPIGYGGTDSIDNLVMLCRECHKRCPDGEDAYKEYKKKGGFVWNFIRIGYSASELGLSWLGCKKVIIKNMRIYHTLNKGANMDHEDFLNRRELSNRKRDLTKKQADRLNAMREASESGDLDKMKSEFEAYKEGSQELIKARDEYFNYVNLF